MKTKHSRSHRKHARHTTGRSQIMSARKRAAKPGQLTKQPHKQEAAEDRLSMEIVPPDAEIPDDGLNLIRSMFCDEDGSYLVMSIEVPVPLTAAYDAWTRFDDVPHFMRGKELPESLDGSRMTWRVRTLFDQFAWQAKVCEQAPCEFIVWKSVQGTPHPGFGSVSFEPISQLRSWIMVQVGFDMSGVYRWLGDPVPSLSHSLEKSLRRFHNLVLGAQCVQALESPHTFLEPSAA